MGYPAAGEPPAKSSSNGGVIVLVILGIVGVCVLLALVCGGIGVALLLPAVQQVRSAARVTEARNTGRIVGLALYNYELTHGAFPPAVSTDENGNALHSWRTELLPYLEQQPLYDSIDRSVSWDHPNNSNLANIDLDTYQSLRGVRQSSLRGGSVTHFVAVIGDDTCFPTDGGKIRIGDVTDGTANTIMFVEYIDSDIPWFEPKDVTVDEAVDLIKGNKDPQGTVVVFCSGAVESISSDIAESSLRAMFTRNGDEAIPGDFGGF